MIYPVNGTRLKLAACFAEGLALWAEQLENDLEFAPGWLDPRVCWFELLEERLGPEHPETKKAAERAFEGEIPWDYLPELDNEEN